MSVTADKTEAVDKTTKTEAGGPVVKDAVTFTSGLYTPKFKTRGLTCNVDGNIVLKLR